LTVTQSAGLYQADFFAWTQQQAAALRRLADTRINLAADLDLTNLIDEVESRGLSDLKGVHSALVRIVEHLTKLEYSTHDQPRKGWIQSVDKQRDELAADLAASPSLHGRIDLDTVWKRGRNLAVKGFALYEPEAARLLPAEGPYTLEQLLDDDWFPVNRHGLT
jgi:hypothetical protein